MRLTIFLAQLLLVSILSFGQVTTGQLGPQFAVPWHNGVIGFHGRLGDSNVAITDHAIVWDEANGSKRRGGDNSFSRLTLQEAYHHSFDFRLRGSGACNNGVNPVDDNRFVVQFESVCD